MRTSRRSVWAVGLLLGMSGCAGVQQRGPVAAPGGVLAEAPSPSGFRGWWGRSFGGGYQPAVHSGLGAIPPAAAFPGASGGGWGSVYQFSRPPWVTRQPQRAPIFSMNPSGVPAGAKMSPAEINEAIARMSAGRRDDDQVLPVRNVDEPRVAADVDREEPSILSRPIRLPDALADVSGDEAARDEDRRVASPPGEPAIARVTDDAGEAEAARTPDVDPAPPIDPLMADAIDEPEPVSAPLVAMTSPAPEPTSREAQDDRLVRSSQLPPPPPIRPEPGVEPPVADPTPPPPLDAPRPEEAPKPAETPKVEEAPKLIEAAPKPAEAPKVEEATKPVEPPKVEEAPKPLETPRPADAPKAQGVPTEPDDVAPPPVRDARPAEQAPKPVPTATAIPTVQAMDMPPVPAAQAYAQAQTQTYQAPVVSAFPNPEPKAHRWSFWNWKSSGHDHGHQQHAVASAQSRPAQLPPATFPTSYESVWAKPLVPCPEGDRIPQASMQSVPVSPSPQAVPTVAEKGPCWLVDRLKTRAHQLKVWKHEKLCKHIQGFKAALKGGKCHDCEKLVTPSPQASPRPTPQTVPTPQAKPSPQELPVIGGSRFGLY